MAEPSDVYQGRTPAIENGGLNPLQLALANYMAIGNPPPFAVNNAFMQSFQTFADPGELSPLDIDKRTGLPRRPDLNYTVSDGFSYIARGDDIYLIRRAQDCGPDENRFEEVFLGKRPDVAAGTWAFYGFIGGGTAAGGSVESGPGGFASPAAPSNSVPASLDAIGVPGNFGGSPGGNGAGAKIICTKLYELGYLPDEIFVADQLFGEWLRENDPYAYYGYIKWASVVVDWMDKDGPQCMFWIRDKKVRNQKQQAMAIAWAKRIATPWAQHMAYKMGVLPEDNRAGRVIMKTGLFISRMIGKLTKATEPTKSTAIGYLMWATFGLFWLMAGLKGK